MFPRKPFLDRVIVEVTPVEKFFEQSGVVIPLDDARVKYRSDRGVVRAIGDGVAMAGVFIEMPMQVGDEVFFDSDNAYAGQIWLLPSDKNKTGLPEYLEIRVGDLLGRGLRVSEQSRPTIEQLEAILNSEDNLKVTIQPDGSVRAE
jgi:co-chaperonin GroES (HSP10)